MRRFLQIAGTCFILFSANYLQGQVRLTTSISPLKINKDQYAQIQFTLENATEVKQLVPPELNDFTIINGPSRVNSIRNINGIVKRYITVTYILKPKKPGKFNIGPAIANADGQNLKSNTVILQVLNGVSGNTTGNNNLLSPFSGLDPFEETKAEIPYSDYILRNGENALEKINKNMFVRAEVNKSTCYVGEPVIANYKLYTRLKSESNLIKNPSLNGFSVIDLQQPDHSTYTREVISGKEYNVYTLRKAQLYPLQPGKLELETAQLENKIRFIKEDYARKQLNDMNEVLRDFTEIAVSPQGTEEHSVILESKPVFISVKPLPENNKPLNFKGAVGKFDISAGLAKSNFTTDDAGKLLVVITGQGNLQLVNAPEIKWPDRMETFEPKATEELNKMSVPVSGKKEFEYTFTVAHPGNYTIPPIELNYYEVRSGQYIRAITKSIDFTVIKGTGKSVHPALMIVTNDKERIFNKIFSNRWWIVIAIAFFLMMGLFIWLLKENKVSKLKKEDNITGKQRSEQFVNSEVILGDQSNPLEMARELLLQNNIIPFYNALNREFKTFLSRHLNIPENELNKKTIIEQLDEEGVSNKTVLQVRELLDEIEWHLYTPHTEAETMKQIYYKASGIIELLNL